MTAVADAAAADPVAQDDAAAMGEQIQGFAMRLLGSIVGMMDLATIRIGIDAGLYGALLKTGPATVAEVAARAGTDARYTREWLEQQAVTGIVTVAAEGDAEERRYALPPAHAEVLVNRDSPAYLGALGSMIDIGAVVPVLAEKFSDGTGLTWSAYGDAARCAQAELNRPGYLTGLAQEWLPAMPDIAERLAAGGARIADVACGAGWSSIAFALAYPDATIDAFDGDDASIADARRNAVAAGVADRVRFEVRDAADPGLDAGAYDLVVAFECIHDMARPVEALSAMRTLAKPDGFVVVADNAVEEDFVAPGTEIDRLLYGSSVLVCLPTGRSAENSEETGAIMRPSTFRTYAQRAGFSDVQVAPVPHPFWRFYRLS